MSDVAKDTGIREVKRSESGRLYVWCGGCEVAALYIEERESILECECGQLGLVREAGWAETGLFVEWHGDVNNPPEPEKPRCGYVSPWAHPETVPDDGYSWLGARIERILGFRR